jgi:UPF0716 protein FxsA
MKILFLLLIVPLTELYVFIEVGSEIGALTTILLIIATAILGSIFMHQQGMATLQKAQMGLADGQVPEKEMLEGIFVFIGGIFLLLPGFITDSLGLLFLIPPIRAFLVTKLIKQREFQFQQRNGNVYEAEWSETTSRRQTRIESNDDVIEGEIIEPKK